MEVDLFAEVVRRRNYFVLKILNFEVPSFNLLPLNLVYV